MGAGYIMDWDGREIAARGRRATGRGLIGIGMAVSTEGKRNAHVISGTMRRSIHAAPHGHSGGNDEATAAGGTDIPDTQIPSWQGNDAVIDVGSWASYACVEEVGRGHAFMQPAVESVSGPRSVALMTRAFAEEGLV